MPPKIMCVPRPRTRKLEWEVHLMISINLLLLLLLINFIENTYHAAIIISGAIILAIIVKL